MVCIMQINQNIFKCKSLCYNILSNKLIWSNKYILLTYDVIIDKKFLITLHKFFVLLISRIDLYD